RHYDICIWAWCLCLHDRSADVYYAVFDCDLRLSHTYLLGYCVWLFPGCRAYTNWCAAIKWLLDATVINCYHCCAEFKLDNCGSARCHVLGIRRNDILYIILEKVVFPSKKRSGLYCIMASSIVNWIRVTLVS